MLQSRKNLRWHVDQQAREHLYVWPQSCWRVFDGILARLNVLFMSGRGGPAFLYTSRTEREISPLASPRPSTRPARTEAGKKMASRAVARLWGVALCTGNYSLLRSIRVQQKVRNGRWHVYAAGRWAVCWKLLVNGHFKHNIVLISSGWQLLTHRQDHWDPMLGVLGWESPGGHRRSSLLRRWYPAPSSLYSC